MLPPYNVVLWVYAKLHVQPGFGKKSAVELVGGAVNDDLLHRISCKDQAAFHQLTTFTRILLPSTLMMRTGVPAGT